jgi:hypothetical protein
MKNCIKSFEIVVVGKVLNVLMFSVVGFPVESSEGNAYFSQEQLKEIYGKANLKVLI